MEQDHGEGKREEEEADEEEDEEAQKKQDDNEDEEEEKEDKKQGEEKKKKSGSGKPRGRPAGAKNKSTFGKKSFLKKNQFVCSEKKQLFIR